MYVDLAACKSKVNELETSANILRMHVYMSIHYENTHTQKTQNRTYVTHARMHTRAKTCSNSSIQTKNTVTTMLPQVKIVNLL